MTSYPPRQRRNFCRLHSTPTVRMRPSACKSHGKQQRYSAFQIVQVTKSECFKYRAQVPGYPSTEIGTGKTRKTSLSDPRKCDEELAPIPSIWSHVKRKCSEHFRGPITRSDQTGSGSISRSCKKAVLTLFPASCSAVGAVVQKLRRFRNGPITIYAQSKRTAYL